MNLTSFLMNFYCTLVIMTNYFKINGLTAAVSMAIALPMIAASGEAEAVIAATHIYHNHMPNFWPYYDTSKYASTPVGGAIRYAYDGQAYQIKINPPAGYTYLLPDGEPMPHDNLAQYYQRDAKENAYTVWPAQTANANHNSHPLSQTQVTMSAAVINNVQSFAELDLFGFKPGWAKDWKSTVGSLKTTNGYNALEPIHFTGHHSMGPLVGPKYFLKDLIYQNVTLQQDYFLGSSFKSSKGFFPTELGFSERLIPTLKKLGVEWSVVGNNHFSRTLTDYPYNYADPSYDTMVSPPNRADLQNTYAQGKWEYVGMAHEQQNILNKYPFCAIPHWVQYVDPVTGKADQIAAIPVDQNGSWLEGWEGIATVDNEISRKEYEADANGRIMYYVIAHDGDNGEGRAGSIDTWLASGKEYTTEGVVGMGVEEYLAAYKIPEDDIQHIQDGSWVDTRDSSSDPDWYHWHIPMGVWKGQLAEFNKALGTEFELPVNMAGTTLGHAVSMEYGYHYLERNFALLQAALSYAETAEQIWLDDHPNYWSPTTDAHKQVTYAGNQLNPYMFSYPVKGDENNDYAGGANPAELGWYFLISSIDSGFGYYDENTDDNVKPTLGFNQSLYFTEPYVQKNLAKDKTGPSMWWVQRYPTNPGSANVGKAEGWVPIHADNTFVIYTYAYDVSGIRDVKVYVRPHKNKSMKATDIAPRVYDPKSVSGADATQVGEWKEYSTKVRDLTPDMNGVAWQVQKETLNYNVLPAKKIGSTYYAYINDYRDQLVDYYMEATDNLGNVTKSEINHTYVGAGRYNLVDGAYIEDVNGEIEGNHVFFSDGLVVLTDKVEVYAKTGDSSVTSVYADHKDKGSSDWNFTEMKQIKGTEYFKTTVTYTRDAGCADVRIRNNGSQSFYNGAAGSCLAKGTYTINSDGSITEGAPTDIVIPVTFYFKPATELSSVCVHYRGTPQTEGDGWTTPPGVHMEAVKNGWWKFTDSETFGADVSGMEFLFNDCANSWYKNASGGNFVSQSVGDVWVDGTKMGSGIPEELDDSNKVPVATISASAFTVEKGESVVLDASGSSDRDGTIVAYKWSTGETSAKITVNPEKTTTYTVTVTDDQGATASKSVTINVKDDITCCVEPFYTLFQNFESESEDLTVSFKDTTHLGTSCCPGDNKDSGKCLVGSEYESTELPNLIRIWDFGDGTTSNEVNPVHTYAKSGTYNVTFTLTRADEESPYVMRKTVKVDQEVVVVDPVAVITTDKTEIAKGDSVVLNGSSSEGEELTYLWSTGENTSSITVSPEATTTYTLVVTDKNGNKSEKASVTITVSGVDNHAPSVVLVTSADNASRVVKAGTAVTLDASKSRDADGDELSYLWSNQKTDAVITEVLDETTTFTVTVTDSNGASSQDSVTITVVSEHENLAPVARINVKNTTVTEGDTVVFDGAFSSDDNGVVSYEWYLDNVLIGDSSTLSHVFDVKGSYEVTLIVKDAEGLQAKDSVVIQVNEQEVIEQDPSVSLSSSSDYVKVGENATFSAAVENFAGNELQYTWLVDGEQVAQSSSATFQYRFTSAGSHKITVKVSDGNKTVESSVMIKVNEEPDIPVKFDFGEGNDASGTEIPFITSDADESKYDALSLAAEKNLIFTIRNITGQATIRVQRSSSSTAATSAVENTCKIISGYKVDCESSSGSDFILVENDSSVNLNFINGGDYKVHVDAKTLTGSDISGYIPVKVEAESTNNEVKDEGGKKGGGAMDPLSLVLMTCAGFFIRRRKQK